MAKDQDCFSRSCESLAFWDQNSLCWKTWQRCLLGDWIRFSDRLPATGTMQNGKLYRRQAWARRTDATGCSSSEQKFATPTATANQLAPSMQKHPSCRAIMPTPKATDGTKGSRTKEGAEKELKRGKNLDLGMVVALWPTPSAQEPGMKASRMVDKNGNQPTHLNQRLYDKETGRLCQKGLTQAVQIAALWPTPTANEDAAGTPNGKMQKMLGNHPDVRNTGAGTLNPQWVEWLMGFPSGWTDLDA